MNDVTMTFRIFLFLAEKVSAVHVSADIGTGLVITFLAFRKHVGILFLDDGRSEIHERSSPLPFGTRRILRQHTIFGSFYQQFLIWRGRRLADEK